MSDPQILKSLIPSILSKTGLKLVSPSDCKAISLAIFKELNKHISETTIKRLFGFAESKNQFSKFTINTLTEFALNQSNISSNIVNTGFSTNLDIVSQHAKQITNCTQQNLKSRCSVPYELTIPRKFAIYDFHYFHQSHYSFTAFIAQPGYGKTILLSHLVLDITSGNDRTYDKDVICFFRVNDIFDPEIFQNTLEENIKSKLGLPHQTDLIAYFDEKYNQDATQLILIFDGFSDLPYDRFTKSKVFEKIIDLISAIGESRAIKLVLSMRSTTWNRFFEKIRHAHFLKQKWYSGSYYYIDYNSNVPPLSEKELELVVEKMNPGSFESINSNLKTQLKFPFHIQWYYKLQGKYPTFNFFTNLLFYELIDLFISEKIFRSNYATEKILLCKQFVRLTDFSKRGVKLIKTDLINHISVYKSAYLELLADGILMEEKHFLDGYPIEYVRFVDSHTFEYFLFIELRAQHEDQLDRVFFQYLHKEYSSNPVRFQLFQWTLRQMIIQGDLKDIASVFTQDLTNYEKNYLIYFIAENLSYQSLNRPEITKKIREQNLHSVLISELIHFDFVDSCYRDAINCLLVLANDNEHSLFYHSILAVIDCLSFNKEQIASRLSKMEAFKNVKINTVFNPYDLVNLINLKLNGVPLEATNETFVKIKQFTNDEINLNPTQLTYPTSESFIEYLLLIVFNKFYGTQQEVIGMVTVIRNNYPNLTKTKSAFSIYLFNVLAIANARVNPGIKTDQMERIITKICENQITRPTLYSQSLLLVLKAQQKKNKKEYHKTIRLANEAITIFNRNDLFLYELCMYNLLISTYILLQDFERANHYNYLKVSLLDNKKIPFLIIDQIDFN